MDIANTMVRLKTIESKENRTMLEMRRVRLEMSCGKKSVEKLLETMNVTESNFYEWRTERSDLKTEIKKLK